MNVLHGIDLTETTNMKNWWRTQKSKKISHHHHQEHQKIIEHDIQFQLAW